MEQTNLVCSPDGKTWDEITRDMSYMGKDKTSIYTLDNGQVTTANVIFDFVRGVSDAHNVGQKDTCVAYDRVIILKDGMYHIYVQGKPNSAGDDGELFIKVNGTLNSVGADGSQHTGKKSILSTETYLFLKRGDYIEITPSGLALYGGASHSTKMIITRKA